MMQTPLILYSGGEECENSISFRSSQHCRSAASVESFFFAKWMMHTPIATRPDDFVPLKTGHLIPD